MSKFLLILLLCIQQIFPNPIAIIDRYANDASEAFIVINDSAGCYYVLNGVLKQIVFQDYGNKYENNYSAFLSDLLKGSIELTEFQHYKLRKRILKLSTSSVINQYLQTGPKESLSFKRKKTKQTMITIMKLMFDSGYYVLFDDYRGEFYFSLVYPFYEMRE